MSFAEMPIYESPPGLVCFVRRLFPDCGSRRPLTPVARWFPLVSGEKAPVQPLKNEDRGNPPIAKDVRRLVRYAGGPTP